MNAKKLGPAAALLTMLCATLSAQAVPTFSFTRIVETGVPLPGSTTTFSSFGFASLDGGIVAFRGLGVDGTEGAYVLADNYYAPGPKTYQVVLDTNTPVPGGSGNFLDAAEPPSIADGLVTARAGYSGGSGIYQFVGGSLSLVADSATPMPGFGTNFREFRMPATDSGRIVLQGSSSTSSGNTGVYLYDSGVLSAVADSNTFVPGEGVTFTGFQDPDISGNNVAFFGQGAGVAGIYASLGGSLKRVVDTNSILPGDSTPLVDFSSAPGISAQQVVFWARSTGGREGIFLYDDMLGDIAVITEFSGLATGSYPSISDGRVAVKGSAGLYMTVGGVLEEVLGIGALLDGKSISDLLLWRDGLSGESVAFRAAFTDGSQGIYVAEVVPTVVPLPAPLWLIGAGFLSYLGLGARRRQTH